MDDALAQARHVSPRPPKALIVPHAGYIYSAPVAAGAYACLRSSSAAIKRVVILGPCHRVPLAGLALPTARAFATPLGPYRSIDPRSRRSRRCPRSSTPTRRMPANMRSKCSSRFCSACSARFAIVPLAVGDATPDEVAEVLDRLWGGPETLIVISSDLSHYHGYDEARRRDEATAQAILRFDAGIDHEQACGATPIAGLLTVAKRRALVPKLLGLCNSGDTAGDRQRVVGYAAFAFHEARRRRRRPATRRRGPTLLKLARGAIHEALGGPALPPIAARWLDAPGACFVTLRQDERLRGCVGSLKARRPLRDDVIDECPRSGAVRPALPAAVRRRARRHARRSLGARSAGAAVVRRSRCVARAACRPASTVLIITSGRTRATFLPQVWDVLPDAGRFVDELIRKTGLPADTPLHSCRFERYRVRKWAEPEATP